jgi:uncharacterized protein (TIGR03083 family)
MQTETPIDEQPVQLPVAPSQVRAAALAEAERLATLVAGLSEPDWTTASAVSGWTVGDVVAHLNLALGLYTRIIDAALGGSGSGRLWKAFGDFTQKAVPAAAPAFNAVNNAVPKLLRNALSPEVIKGQLAAGTRGLRQRLDKVGSADYTRPIYYMGRPWPLSFFLAAVVNEIAVHGWDIASRLTPDAHLSEDARAVLPWFYWSATPFMFHVPAGFRGTIQAELVDPPFQMWWGHDTSGMRQGTGEVQPDATIRAESGTFVLILAGRISVDDALGTTSTVIEGNEALARQFLGAWRIV